MTGRPRPYHDFDEFRRDTGPGDVCSLDRIDHISDHVFITNRMTGRAYRMTCNQAISEGMGGYAPGDLFTLGKGRYLELPGQTGVDPGDPSTTTHVLFRGSPLCGFSHSRPVDWPKGHDLVTYEHFKQVPEGFITGVTCEPCGEAATKMRRG